MYPVVEALAFLRPLTYQKFRQSVGREEGWIFIDSYRLIKMSLAMV